MSPPSLSAILCTFNRAEMLSQTLESILGQTLDRSNFELIVIDDGSIDDTRKVVESFERRLPLRYAYQANAGLASARNHGIYRSQAPLLLFLDDDDVCSPNLFEEHLKTHVQYPDNHFAVLGYVALDPNLAQKPVLHYVTEVGCYLFSYPNLKHGDVLDYTYFWGGCSSCKRKFLIEYGVFNPVFRFGCEDIELAYRLSKNNLKVVYNAHAVSTMVRDISFDAFCTRLIRQGESQYVFSQLHPDAEVQNLTEMIGAEEEWQRIETVYEAVIRSARELDRIANLKIELGLELDDITTNLLQRAYRNAFKACKLKGIYNRRSETLKTENNGNAGPAMEMRSRKLDLGKYNTDKITLRYLEWYDPIFKHFVPNEIKLLELGIYKGGSLLLWRDYFPKGTIVGIDIQVKVDFSNEERVQVFQGAQQDTTFLSEVARKTAPEGFDIIIDDASHFGNLTRIAFWHLFDNHLKPSGFYVIEDWGTGYWSDWPDGKTYRRRPELYSRFLSLLKKIGLVSRIPYHSHPYGMVGFIKVLLDEQGASNLTRERLTGTATRASKFESMTITPSIVFIKKRST